MVPLVLMVYSGSFINNDDGVKVDFEAIVAALLLVLLPAAIGVVVKNWIRLKMCFRRKNTSKMEEQTASPSVPGGEVVDHCLDGGVIEIDHGKRDDLNTTRLFCNPNCVDKAATVLQNAASIVGCLFLIPVGIASGMTDMGKWTSSGHLAFSSFFLMPFGTIIGYLISFVVCKFKVNEKWLRHALTNFEDTANAPQFQNSDGCSRDESLRLIQMQYSIYICKTISLETGMQNAAMALAFVSNSWDSGDIVGEMRNVAAYCGLFIVVNGFILTVIYRLHPWFRTPLVEEELKKVRAVAETHEPIGRCEPIVSIGNSAL